MLDSKHNPVEWATLLYELDDAKEHLQSLVDEMKNNGNIDEINYEIKLGHIFAHLNRAWNTRNQIGEYSDKEHEQYTLFPNDLEPCG